MLNHWTTDKQARLRTQDDSSHMVDSDFILDLFKSNRTMALETCGQLFSTDEGLARRLLHETNEAIDLMLQEFDRVVAPRSSMTHHSSSHQDPPPGGLHCDQSISRNRIS